VSATITDRSQEIFQIVVVILPQIVATTMLLEESFENLVNQEDDTKRVMQYTPDEYSSITGDL